MKRKLLFFGSIITGMAAIIGFLFRRKKKEAKPIKTDEPSYDYIEHADGRRLRLPDDPETREQVMDALFPQPKKAESRNQFIWNGVGGFLGFYVMIAAGYLIFGPIKLGWAVLLVAGFMLLHRKMGWQSRTEGSVAGLLVAIVLFFMGVLVISLFWPSCCQDAYHLWNLLV